MAIQVSSGVNKLSRGDLAGMTIRDLRDNESFVEALNLNDDQAAEVRHGAAGNYVAADNNYVLRDGDFVRFSRAAGTKGC